MLSHLRVDHKPHVKLGPVHLGCQQLLQTRLNRDRLQNPRLRFVLGHKVGPQSAAHMLGKLVRIFGQSGHVAEVFHDGRQVLDGNAFPEKILKNALDDPHPERFGHHIGHQHGLGFLERIQERLHVLAAQNEMRLTLHRLRQMGNQDGTRVDHGKTMNFRSATLLVVDPSRLDSKNRLHRGESAKNDRAVGHVHRQPVLQKNLAA